MSHDPSDRFLILSFPSISHWVTLPRATSSSSPLSSHLDAVHHAAQQTTQSLTVVIRTPSDAPSPWRNPSAPTTSTSTTSSPPPSSSPSSDSSLSPTALFLPLEQALARVYNAATSAFFASDDGPLKNVDVVVEQLRDISRVCIPQDAQVDRWEWTDAAAEGDGKGKGKADGARAPPPPPEAGASSGLPPLYPVVALGGTFDHLHAGHKILLTMACSLCSSRLVVGVSDDHLLVNKKYRHLVQSLDERLAAVTRFVALVRPAIECDAVPLQDVYGPTAHDPSIEALVVSDETRAGGDTINTLRSSRALNPLRIFSISLVAGSEAHHNGDGGGAAGQVEVEVATKMGSTGIREWLDRRGRGRGRDGAGEEGTREGEGEGEGEA